jgi:hypothetical protein
MQRKEPVASTGFPAAQFRESWSRSAAVRVGRHCDPMQSFKLSPRGAVSHTDQSLDFLSTKLNLIWHCDVRATHLITSSARKSSAGGTVTPMDFATLRLTTSSSFVGCSMGRSPGLAPLRIFATNSAALR